MLINHDEEKEYFIQSLHFLYETTWLYQFPVTEILARNLLDYFPTGWSVALKNLNNEELNNFVVDKITKREFPESLLSFVEKCLRLDKIPTSLPVKEVEILPKSFTVGLSKKKQHEILRLANTVKSQCEKKGIKIIVDLGAGLGYVCQLLNYLYDYRVLGLESNPKNVEAAKNRQEKFYPTSIDRVNYICAKIDLDSEVEIKKFLRSTNNEIDADFCLIGLHACGDLGVDACKLFAKISSAKIFILLSCCYHKMEMIPDEKRRRTKFRNFPMSNTLIDIFESSDREYYNLLERPFLRLACQEPAVRWHEMSKQLHHQHAFYVLSRALLESFAQKNSIILRKNTRKATRKSQCVDFKTYLEDAMLRYEFKFKNEESSMKDVEIREEVLSAWNQISERLDEAEIYTGLQLMLQSPAESLVLRDRRYWLVEKGFDTEIISVTNRNCSPRSHAILSIKIN